jgi:hypothetical protein
MKKGFGTRVKPLVPAAFNIAVAAAILNAMDSIHQTAQRGEFITVICFYS